jgi:hypothetical protein
VHLQVQPGLMRLARADEVIERILLLTDIRQILHQNTLPSPIS